MHSYFSLIGANREREQGRRKASVKLKTWFIEMRIEDPLPKFAVHYDL